MHSDLIFHQLFEPETATYTYLIADKTTKEAIIIDPVIEMIDRDYKLIQELGLSLKYVLDTHVHADHITASGDLRKRTGAKVAVSSFYDMSCPDIHLNDGEELRFGDQIVSAIHTPGHTKGCLTYKIKNMIFTGDALLIRGCGRTDFQEGSSEKLFMSVREKIFSLPDDTIIYPAHDYKGFSKSSIWEEKKFNPRLNLEVEKEHFIQMMKNLNLPHPKKIQESVPANLMCGLSQKSPDFKINLIDGIPNVMPEDFKSVVGKLRIIDVRGVDEFNGELGHIHTAELAVLGPELDKKLSSIEQKQNIIFICRSGKRSTEAVKLATLKGFEKVYNLYGGMLKWNELGLPVEINKE